MSKWTDHTRAVRIYFWFERSFKINYGALQSCMIYMKRASLPA